MIHIFIINNAAGKEHLADGIRQHLEKRTDLKYFAFNTVESGEEASIAAKVSKYFDGERIRYYACGGSGTFRNMLNGISDLTNSEVAFFPCGLTNDFLKSFDDNEKFFHDLDNLINGQCEPIDYIKTNHGIAINSVSYGIDSRLIHYIDALRVFDIFGSQVPYVLALLVGVISSVPRKLILNIDDDETMQNYSEIILTNGCVLGGNLRTTSHANITDGKASFYVTVDKKGPKLLPDLFALMKANYKKLAKLGSVGEASHIEICSADGSNIVMNLDGELVDGGRFWSVDIINKGINFVIPKKFDFSAYKRETEGHNNG